MRILHGNRKLHDASISPAVVLFMHSEEGVGGEEMAMLGNESLPLTESLVGNLRDRFPLHHFIYRHVA